MNLTYIEDLIDPPANRSLAFQDLPNIMDTSIANLFLIYKNDRQNAFIVDAPYSAIEMIFYWCVGEHRTDVKNGVPSINPVKISTDIKTNDGSLATSPGIVPHPLFPEDSRRDVLPSTLILSGGKDKQDNYSIEYESNNALKTYLKNTLNGITFLSTYSAESDSAEVMTSALYESITIGNSSKTMTFQQAKDLQLKSVDTVVTNIATSLSNK